MAKDRVIEAAEHALTGTLCECSHWEGEHRSSENWPKASPKKYGAFCEPHCRCRQFRPVTLKVTRQRKVS